METRYICKRFTDTTPLVFSEIINISKPVRKITIESLANVDSTIPQYVWDTDNKVPTAVIDSEFYNPLPIKFCLLQSDITPERNIGSIFIGGDFEGSSAYKYIFKQPKEFSGQYQFSIVSPANYLTSNPDKNDYSVVVAPKDNTYVSIKIEFIYAETSSDQE